MSEKTRELPACCECGQVLHPISKQYGLCLRGAGVNPGFCTEGRLIPWTEKEFIRTRRLAWMAQFPTATQVSMKLFRVEDRDGTWEKYGKSLRIMARPEPEKQVLRPGQAPKPRPEEVFASVGHENKVYCFRRPTSVTEYRDD